MAGGFLMAIVGALYLAFEETLLRGEHGSGPKISPAENTLSRPLIGVQVRTS